MNRTLGLVACLIVGLLAAGLASRTPQPPANPAPDQFQATRAIGDIAVIAQRGHPIGSADHARVRDYLLGRMRQLGLEVRTQTGEGVESRARGDRAGISGGEVTNLVATLPGRDRTLPPLVLQAHYDSVANSPGAADDGTGVAVALDIARALKARGQPLRDVVLLITDGEESGLLGAQAFYASDPLARRIGLVLNMEARGDAGRVSMFETSDNNGGLINAFRKVTPDTTSTSLAIFIYQHMPNGTDLTVVKKAGVAGLNYAFVGKQFDYHAGSSTLANLDRGSVQHMGQQVLAAAQAFAYAPSLPGRAPDLVYGDLLGHPIVAYPQWAGWLVLLAGAGLAVTALARARRVEPLSWTTALKGAGALVLAVVLAGGLAFGARLLTGMPIDFIAERPLLAQFGRFETGVFALCLGALFLVFAALAGRNPRPWSAWAGVLGLGFVLAVGLQVVAAPVAFTIAWPLLVAGLIAVIIAFAGDAAFDSLAATAAMTVGGGLILGQILYMAHFVALCVGADMPSALAAFALLAALVMAPVMWGGGRRQVLAGAGLLVLGLGIVLAIRLSDPASPRQPRATEVLYVADADDGHFWRVSATPATDAWTRSVLAADGGKAHNGELSGFGDKLSIAPARPIAVARPQASLSADASGRSTLRLVQAADSEKLVLGIKSDRPVAATTVAGERVPMQARRITIIWSAPGKPTDIVFEAPPGAKLDIKVSEVRETWPTDARPLPPRPADTMAFGDSDTTVSVATAR